MPVVLSGPRFLVATLALALGIAGAEAYRYLNAKADVSEVQVPEILFPAPPTVPMPALGSDLHACGETGEPNLYQILNGLLNEKAELIAKLADEETEASRPLLLQRLARVNDAIDDMQRELKTPNTADQGLIHDLLIRECVIH